MHPANNFCCLQCLFFSMFYERLKELCKQKGTTVTTVVKELGMSTGNISKWKNGNKPKADSVSALAEYLGVSTDYLLGIEEVKQKSLDILDSQVFTLTDKEKDFIRRLRKLDDEGRTMVESTLIQELRRIATDKGEADTVSVG